MPKATSEKTIEKSSRLIRRGDIVRVPTASGDGEMEEVVRGVDILLHLANGIDVVVAGDIDLVTVDESELTGRLEKQLAAIRAEETS